MSRRSRRRSPATPLPLFNTQATPLQAGDGEFVCGFNCPPSISFFSHWSLFQLKLYSVHCAACCPLVDTANKSLLLPSHALETRGEGGNGEFFSPFLFPPFQTFSDSFFLRSNCHPVHHASHPPSVNQGNKFLPPPPPLRLLRGEDGDSEFPLNYFFFIPNFFS